MAGWLRGLLDAEPIERDPAYEYGAYLPYRMHKQTRAIDWAPQYSELLRGAWDAVRAPMQAWNGEPVGVEDALNVALNMSGGGVVAGKVPRGAVGMAGRAEKPRYPQAQALETARQNAVKMLGLTENNTPLDRARAMGFEDFYHGTERLDRVLQKKGVDPKRATSGPNLFGTDSRELASNYAKNKADTSRVAADDGDIKNYFQVSPKDLGYRGSAPYSVEQSWHLLSPEKRAEILDKSRRVGYENLDEADGNFTLHPPGVDATQNGSHFDWLLKNEARGNPLTAMRQMWYEGGTLVNSPEELATLYRLAGYEHPISQANAPWYSANGVLTGMARAKNPLNTADIDNLKNNVVPALQEALKGDRTRLKPYGADAWDKSARYTPKQWVDELANDVSQGKNSHVFTSIPDKITEQLRRMGYDAIHDVSGKGGGEQHKVIIPFSPQQIRSRFAAFDPARIDENDLLAMRGLPALRYWGLLQDEPQN